MKKDTLTNYILAFVIAVTSSIFLSCRDDDSGSSSITPMPMMGSWHKSDMGFTFGQQGCLIVGDGRNDGIMRVYSGDGIWAMTGNIHEFSYSDDQWAKSNVGGDDYNSSYSSNLVIGTARNDGSNRLYASSGRVVEFIYESNSWQVTSPGDIYVSGISAGLVIGDARNDNQERLYVSNLNSIIELTYNNNNWDIEEIDTGVQWIHGLVITDGRGDGILRLYVLGDMLNNHVYEYTWTGAEWEVEDCGSAGENGGYNNSMSAGNGRNDGRNRIYLAADGIKELSYVNGSWQYDVITSDDSMIEVAVGDGRGDGINRIYVAGNDTEDDLEEYTFNGAWSKTLDIDKDIEINGIAIGDGRNDNKNRVYVTGGDNHLYEYSFE